MTSSLDTSTDGSPGVLIVGAGLAGLTCGRELRRAGVSATIVDKGRSVGGRLATRRIGDATLDHGAQFFTVRGGDLQALVDAAAADELAFEWCRGFGDPPDGYPRYAIRGGMNQLAKWLARDQTVELNTELAALTTASERWIATSTHGGTFAADTVVLTAPVPQSLRLLDAGDVTLPDGLTESLAQIDYFATLGLLVVLDQSPTTLPSTGAWQLDDGPFTFVADNHRKGISSTVAMTFHAAHDYSARRYDDDPDEVLSELLTLAEPWLAGASVREAQLKKWRYAGPKKPWPDATIDTAIDGARLLFAGDAFAGPKVEGAFNSGLAAARAIIG